jgi:hypothetical protein
VGAEGHAQRRTKKHRSELYTYHCLYLSIETVSCTSCSDKCPHQEETVVTEDFKKVTIAQLAELQNGLL